MDNNINEFLEFIKKPGYYINKNYCKYLQAALDKYDGIATFYCMPKVHKNKIPVPLRTVVATLNTPINVIGKLVSLWLKLISKQVSTFIRDSDHLIRKLHQLGEIKSNDFLFTAYAVAMCPNIDTEEGIAAILISF